MRTEWTLTREAFDNLLSWLAPDRDHAGRIYEEIRRKLIRLFTCRGCDNPEDLADETINRVIKAIEVKTEEYSGDPILFFFAVAKRVFLESIRKKAISPEDMVQLGPGNREEEFQCLESCMARLPEHTLSLIKRYYAHEGREKINARQLLAEELGFGMNSLRI
jgi:DNA-directed RNA polymerase specialized sigma24 family protein